MTVGNQRRTRKHLRSWRNRERLQARREKGAEKYLGSDWRNRFWNEANSWGEDARMDEGEKGKGKRRPLPASSEVEGCSDALDKTRTV